MLTIVIENQCYTDLLQEYKGVQQDMRKYIKQTDLFDMKFSIIGRYNIVLYRIEKKMAHRQRLEKQMKELQKMFDYDTPTHKILMIHF
jgi:hypothetical protein